MTDFLRAVIWWVLIWFLPVVGLSIAFYFLASLPGRRNERGRFFLDLLETGIEHGHSPEQTVLSASQTRESSVGARFHLVAAYIEQGLRLPVAIGQVPGFLPPGAAGLLSAGEAAGDYPRGIAAARLAITSPLTRTHSAMHYAFALLCILGPTALVIMPIWQIFIWPKFKQIFNDMTDGQPPGFTMLIMENIGWLVLGYATLALLLLLAFVLWQISPRLFTRPDSWLGLLLDRWAYSLSWHRKRVHRDFSLCLGMLLEKAFPEKEAIILAAKGTGNRFVLRKASGMVNQLERGVNLPEALMAFDETGEFQWRMANALSGGGFHRSLAGWHESLEAEAWRREETVAHILSTGILVFNGAFVGFFMSAVFLFFVSLIEEALW